MVVKNLVRGGFDGLRVWVDGKASIKSQVGRILFRRGGGVGVID